MKNPTKKSAVLDRAKQLPKKLTVFYSPAEEGGYVACVKELPHCYTQADNLGDLVTMVNDAVRTYLDIPPSAKGLPYYLPVSPFSPISGPSRRRTTREFQQYVPA